MRDVTKKLIAERAGYGLARNAWLLTLEQIRALPMTVCRGA